MYKCMHHMIERWHVIVVSLRLSYVRSMSDHDGHSIVALAVSATSGDIVSASHQGWSAFNSVAM